MESDTMKSVRELLSAEDEEEKQLQQLHEQMTGFISKLPIDMIVDILSRLPTKSLSQCRWVSKSWYNLISHPRFIVAQHVKAINTTPSLLLKNRHNNHVLINHQDMVDHLSDLRDMPTVDSLKTLVPPYHQLNFNPQSGWDQKGYCDGLLWYQTEENKYFVCNPITRETMCLPHSSKSNSDNDWVHGFGFDHKRNEFKFLIIFMAGQFEAEVYTLGRDASWTSIPNISYFPQLTWWKNGVCLRGAFHWLGYNNACSNFLIVCFDLTTEKFGDIPLPSTLQQLGHVDAGHYYSHLRVLRGFLYFVDASGDKQMEVWVMKDYGVLTSWSRVYIIRYGAIAFGCNKENPPYFLNLIHRGEMLLQLFNGHLLYYNPEKEEWMPISTQNFPHMYRALTILHAESLISPWNVTRLNKRFK